MPTVPPIVPPLYNTQDAQAALDNKENFLDYQRRYSARVTNIMSAHARAINQGVDFRSQATQPTPELGQLMVWYDSGLAAWHLLYNNNGTVVVLI